jgi:DNA-binding NtrC family response regulator
MCQSVADTEVADVSDCPVRSRILAGVGRVAESTISVLLVGEAGTGKRMVAEHLHRASGRGPYIEVNCRSSANARVHDELFGHDHGLFDKSQVGHGSAIAKAQGGTLFLAEVSSLPLTLQGKLARLLERRTARGEASPAPRIVTSSRLDLVAEVSAGRFREELYFRIAGTTLRLPPLRERPDDILPLVEYFLRRAALEARRDVPRVSKSASEALLQHSWPHNAREVRNAIEYAFIVSDGRHVGVEHLPPWLVGDPAVAAGAALPHGAGHELDAMERVAIIRALEASNGNRTHAAQQLGISRRSLLYKIARFKLPGKAQRA